MFCCDNLAFSGEVKLARKHTRFILRDLPRLPRLPRLAQAAVGKLMERWHHQDQRIVSYKLTDLDDRTAHDLVVRALDVGVCPNRLIPLALHEWRMPRYQEFQPRNVRGLFNAFIETLKGNLHEPPRLTDPPMPLHGLLDPHVGLSAWPRLISQRSGWQAEWKSFSHKGAFLLASAHQHEVHLNNAILSKNLDGDFAYQQLFSQKILCLEFAD